APRTEKGSSAMADRPGFHVDTLKLRVSGRDAAHGREIGSALAGRLTRDAQRFLSSAPPGALHVPGVRPQLRAPEGSDVPGAASAAILRAVARAARPGRPGGENRGR